jgi:hypothetical protein
MKSRTYNPFGPDFEAKDVVVKNGGSSKLLIGLAGAIVVLLAACLIVLLTVKERTRTVTHTVTSVQTQYVNEAPPLNWGIGACAKNNSDNTESLVSCKSAFDWVIVGETTNKDSCLQYTTNGGASYVYEYISGSTPSDYYCEVP